MSTDWNNSQATDAITSFVALIQQKLQAVDQRLESGFASYGVTALRLSLALVFFWFGIVKPFDVSPANPVVRTGIFFLPFDIFFPILGWWEAAVGIGLLFKRTIKLAVYLMVFQMLGTMIPLFTAPGMTFISPPFIPSEVGAYIIKNWVLLSSGLVVLAKTDLEGNEWDSNRRVR